MLVGLEERKREGTSGRMREELRQREAFIQILQTYFRDHGGRWNVNLREMPTHDTLLLKSLHHLQATGQISPSFHSFSPFFYNSMFNCQKICEKIKGIKNRKKSRNKNN